jgi:hypothetical protein
LNFYLSAVGQIEMPSLKDDEEYTVGFIQGVFAAKVMSIKMDTTL